jgi:hypothetical protein
VLTAIGLSPAEARASVRLSLGPSNTEDDIAAALELIPAAVARQREVSAEWTATRRATMSFSAPSWRGSTEDAESSPRETKGLTNTSTKTPAKMSAKTVDSR